MSKKEKKPQRDPFTKIVVLVTVLIELIKSVIELITKLLE